MQDNMLAQLKVAELRQRWSLSKNLEKVNRFLMLN